MSLPWQKPKFEVGKKKCRVCGRGTYRSVCVPCTRDVGDEGVERAILGHEVRRAIR